MKIWFQNRRYKCKRQLSDKPLDGSGANEMTTCLSATPPPLVDEPTAPMMHADKTDDIIISANEDALMLPEQAQQPEPVVYGQQQQLPPYSTLYGNAVTNPYGGYGGQDLNYITSGGTMDPSTNYYPANSSSFHHQQHGFSSSASVRAW